MGADYSATGVLNMNTNDLIMCVTGLDTDAGTPSAHTLTGTTATFSSYTATHQSDTTSGDDCSLEVGYATVTLTGTAPVFSFTNASPSSGGTLFVRVRPTAVTTTLYQSGLSASSAAAGTTSISITPQAVTPDKSVNFLAVVAKPYDATITTPTGWTVHSSIASGSTGSSADLGSTLTKIFYKLGALSSTAITVEGATANTMMGSAISFSCGGDDLLDFEEFTTGADDTSGADFSATCSSGIDLIVDDFVLEVCGINATPGPPTSETITATGATLGSYVGLIEDTTALGDNCRLNIGRVTVTAGSSDVAPSFAYTNANNTAGGVILTRIRAAEPTITVAYTDDSDENPGIDVSLTGLPTYGYTYKVAQLSASGEYPSMAVRGADMVEPTSSVAEHTDYEAPLDQDLQYTLYIYDGETLILSMAATPPSISLLSEVDGGAPLEYFHLAFLKNVTTPSLSRRIPLVDFSRWTAPGRVLSNSNVLGRKNPVVITDVTGGKKGSFIFLTWTNVDFSGYLYKDFIASMEEVELLLESGDTLLFQTTSQFTGRDIFMKIEDISVTRLNKPPVSIPVAEDHEHTPCLLWELTFVEVDRPLTEGLAFAVGVWQDVLDDPAYDDWAGTDSTFASWLEVLQYYGT